MRTRTGQRQGRHSSNRQEGRRGFLPSLAGKLVLRTTVCVLALGSAAMAAAAPVLHWGWRPLVVLAGEGDPGTAVVHLETASNIMDSALKRMDIDGPTQAFIDTTWETLEDFEIDSFYERMPRRDGVWHQLELQGEPVGQRYKLGQPARNSDFRVSAEGRRNGPGMLSAVMRARKVQPRGEVDAKPNFLLHTSTGMGIGGLSWETVVDSARDMLRLIGSGAPGAADRLQPALPAPAGQTVAKLRARNPRLDAQDARVLGVLWESFPTSLGFMQSISRFEDVLSENAGAQGEYQHLTGSLRVVPDLVDKRYPALAEYLEDLDRLMKSKFRWTDRKGRALLKGTTDTNSLRFTFECYVKDGQLLPFRGKRVWSDEPVDPMGTDLARTRVRVDAVARMLGLEVHMRNVRGPVRFGSSQERVKIRAGMTDMPELKIEGAALGFVPTSVIDLFIPGNIQQLMDDFMRTAVEGNDGKGVALDLRIGQASPGGAATIETEMGLEALDNFMIKMGMGIVADRIIPDDDAIEEIKRAAIAGHDAFRKDLQQFSARVAPSR